jgi:AcrR family transcriptional regulator
VLAATRRLLAESGYPALTFSEVAERAGVTRQLVHRWWSGRPALVSEALFTSPDVTWPTAYDGPLEADLRRFVTALVDYACRADVRAGVTGLMAETDADTELPGLEEGLLRPLHASLAELIETGVARGDTRPGIDVTLTLNTLRGAVTMQLLADRTRPDVVVDHLTELTTWAFGSPDHT